jgi:hypothetical protein
MQKKGRPVTKPPELKSGFYIELRTKGASSPVKVRRDTKPELEMAIKQYEKSKMVTYLGEVKAGRWLDGKNKGKKTN